MSLTPTWPIFIPSKGRSELVLTARCLDRANVPFHIVVEPQEKQKYVNRWGRDRVLTLPKNDQGLVYSRNWIKEHSIKQKQEWHWQFDDDIHYFCRLHLGYRHRCDPKVAICVLEDFVARYENIGLASFNDTSFLVVSHGCQWEEYPPYRLNFRCYTNFLVWNALPYRWRHRYNEDTDMTLQVLAGGWCTVLFNAFHMKTAATLTRKGGQMASSQANYNGDGRLKMARALERVWPGVVTTKRRFHRAQHSIRGLWRGFDQPLKPKANPPAPREYGLTLVPRVAETTEEEVIP